MKDFLTTMVMMSTVVQSSRLPRQLLEPKQIVDVSCSACEQRLAEKPPQVCCRCIDEAATCNTDTGKEGVKEVPPGLACEASIECDLFGDCPPDQGCKIQDTNVVDSDLFLDGVIDFRQGERRKCPSGQQICCNPGPGGAFEKRLGLVSPRNPLGVQMVDTQEICEDTKLSAVQDFGKGVTCGKRDSRYIYLIKTYLLVNN